uniref:Polyketide cyclase n=1 Tax=Tetraselmis sp. GSL018 TaxID=582737 RepID=A0A061RIX2_9CHLO
MWHMEVGGIEVPMGKGLSFYQFNSQGRICRVRESPEHFAKVASATPMLLRLSAPFLRRMSVLPDAGDLASMLGGELERMASSLAISAAPQQTAESPAGAPGGCCGPPSPRGGRRSRRPCGRRRAPPRARECGRALGAGAVPRGRRGVRAGPRHHGDERSPEDCGRPRQRDGGRAGRERGHPQAAVFGAKLPRGGRGVPLLLLGGNAAQGHAPWHSKDPGNVLS